MNQHDTAFPFVNRLVQSEQDNDNRYGLSKLEYTTIKMVPLIIVKYPGLTFEEVAEAAKELAKIVLQKCNV